MLGPKHFMMCNRIISKQSGSFQFLNEVPKDTSWGKMQPAKEKLMEWVNKINTLSLSTNLYWLQEVAVDFIKKLFVISHCHSVAGKFLNLVKLYVKSAFYSF